MKNTKILVYNFGEHGLYYENDFVEKLKTYTFTIDTLQMEFDYMTGNLLSIKGFLPLVNAKRNDIFVPRNEMGAFSIAIGDFEWLQGVAYEYCDYYPESIKYLFLNDLPKIEYDEENKRILIGTQDFNDNCIKIDKNIFCGFDKNDNLKFILLSLDKVIPCN